MGTGIVYMMKLEQIESELRALARLYDKLPKETVLDIILALADDCDRSKDAVPFNTIKGVFTRVDA